MNRAYIKNQQAKQRTKCVLFINGCCLLDHFVRVLTFTLSGWSSESRTKFVPCR